MKKHIGNLEVKNDLEIDFEEITGFLKIDVNVKLVASKLKTVGGYVYVNSNASLEAPKLETVGGYVYIYSNASLPKLETVGGDVYVNSNASLPKLETVGGDVSVYSNASLEAPKLKNKNSETAKETCSKALELSFKKKKLIKIDGILSWFQSKKKVKNLTVFKVKIVGKLNFSFIVQKNEQFSHGKTLKEASESLRYKLSDRDTSKFKQWKLTTKISAVDAIQAYRAITGACEFGVKTFCESIKMPKHLTVKQVIVLTKNKYGNETFKNFFNSKESV